MRSYTEQEKLIQAGDIFKIKNLMGRRAYYRAAYDGEREIDELWVTDPELADTAALGDNRGYQIGLAQIKKNACEAVARRNEALLKSIREKRPDYDKAPGVGCSEFSALTTPYIYFSEDGTQAQGMWYSPGQVTITGGDGVRAAYVFKRVVADFIKEKDGWKIWRLFEGTDLMFVPGTDFTKQPVDVCELDLYSEFDFTERTHEFEAYTSRYNWSVFPKIPDEFVKFDETNTTGPESNPRFGG